MGAGNASGHEAGRVRVGRPRSRSSKSPIVAITYLSNPTPVRDDAGDGDSGDDESDPKARRSGPCR